MNNTNLIATEVAFNTKENFHLMLLDCCDNLMKQENALYEASMNNSFDTSITFNFTAGGAISMNISNSNYISTNHSNKYDYRRINNVEE